MSTAPEERKILVHESAVALGAKWARSWCDTMRGEGRPVAGGWPGTVAEARARVAAFFRGELAKRGLPRLTIDELSWASKEAYASARHDWHALCAPPRRRTARR